ncbi:hypothetical protein PHLCEN_2v1060 [Hermanssonia centrifuga]|uniref:Oligopeptide transporter n=1 Tax=Hermanssonia centrifuga TaxID=98765 RepID=A0A2R6S474_9APHY|nr:hypothetical protein PHLCEN_2v1060 [Hermanssonia centrifuga]
MSASAIPTLSRRRVPDVPEDVDDVMEHFNDPNWDYRPPSPTLSTESIDLDRKGKTFSETSRHSTSDFDTESNAESTYVKTAAETGASKSQLWRTGTRDYEDDSPYPEVRAAVSNMDDPSMPVNTFRMWFLGLLFTVGATAINQILGLRSLSMTINTLAIQVAVLPFGKAFAYFLPRTRFNTFGYVWTLNPGPFNVKEHTVIIAMANMTWTTSYVLSVFLVQQVNYGQQLSYSYKILLGLSTQLIGIAYAGLYRKFLVWPSSMIYPGTLVSCSLTNTLHRTWGIREKSHISREKFFFIVMVCAGVWYFVPGFLFTGLSIFSWACWIAPTNPAVNTVFGSATGLGMGLLTFDWTMISIIGNPLVSPWWAEINIYACFVFLAWFIAPILYFTNTWFSKYMPISATAPFDNTGLPYDLSAVITDGKFDNDKYQAYSPLYLTTMNVLTYSVCFGILPATVVHTWLWYGKDLLRQFRSKLADNRDVHSRLMMAYPEVPMLWYGLLFVFCFAAGIAGIEIFPTGFPVWALIVSIIIPVLLILPVGIIRAVTNQWIQLSFISDLIGGYIIPGQPVAHMIFKTYVTWPAEQANAYLAGMKMGHYMHVPPRIMFIGQTVAVFVTAFVSQAVVDYILSHSPDACTPLATDGFTCPTNGLFADGAIIWGAVGPQRLFSPGQLYNPLLWLMLICAFLPIPFWLLARRYPYSRWRYVNIPAALSAAMYFPPATGMQFTSWFIGGAIFQWFVRRFHFRWWMRYNYVLAAALDAGVAFGAIFVFLFTSLPKGGLTLDWWGNTVWMNTNDAMAMPFTLLAPNATFGPTFAPTQ